MTVILSKWPGGHKFKNTPTEVDGILFQSKKEATRWRMLLLLQKAGKIKDLSRQVSYRLDVNEQKICTYIADFLYHDVDLDRLVVEDVKGVRTPEYKLKRKLMLAIYGIEIKET